MCAFTISNDSIKTFLLPNARKKKVIKDIPRQKQMKSYPAVLIGRLGVNKNYRSIENETDRTTLPSRELFCCRNLFGRSPEQIL